MSSRRHFARGLIAMVIATAVALTPAVAQVSPARAVGTEYSAVAGSGSSWSANAVTQWIRNVAANYGWTITFNNNGSTAGRTLFAQGSMDFGVSEIPYALSGSDAPDPRPARSFAYVPIVAGGTSFMYNLVIGGQRVTNLRLSGETIAKIFTGVITKWNDPAVLADNPKLALPAVPVVPVVRSDGSGTSAQLTAWMRAQYPAIWNAYCARAGRSNCGITSNYPVIPGTAFVAQQGSDGVSNFVRGDTPGAITYVEASYAIEARFPIAKVLNAAGYYTEPTASNVAVSLLAAVINSDPNSQEYLTANLSGVYGNPDPRTYPLSSYSYMIIPTAIEGIFTENKGLTLADFVSYYLCEGQQQAEALGYSPLPVNLASAGLSQALKIPGGNPRNKDISTCNNPTFSPDGTNKLANEAPQPQACDKKGPDQCLTGTGGATEGTPASSGGGGAGAGPSATNGPIADGGPTVEGDEVVGLSGGGVPVVAGSPIDLPGRTLPVPTLFVMLLAVVIALTAVLLPPLIARRRAAAAGGAPSGARERGKWPPMPSVHLRVPFRKGGRAVPPGTDS